MLRYRLWILLLVCAAFVSSGCGPIPTEPEIDVSDSGERLYVDDEWGFQIALPDPATWGYSAQTSYNDPLPNGLPRTEVRILHSATEGSSFQPTLFVRPQPLDSEETIEILATSVDATYKASYLGYRAEPRRFFSLGDAEAVDWVFSTVPLRSVGNQFYVALVKDGRKGYLMLGTGLYSNFPLDTYREMVASMEFR